MRSILRLRSSPEHSNIERRARGAFSPGGIDRFSRHPIYVGVYLISIASILCSPHWAVIVCSATAIVIHHRIARAEEASLEKRFGAEWLAYKAKVRMYF